MRRAISRSAVLALALVLAGCAHTVPPRRHPELAVRRERIKRVALLPPDVGGGAPPFTERRLIEATLLQLERLGFEVTYLAAATGGELEAPAAEAQAALGDVFATGVPLAEAQAAYFRRSFGAGAQQLAASAAADALAVVRLHSVQSSAAADVNDPLVAARERGHALFHSGSHAPPMYIPPPIIFTNPGPPPAVATLQVGLIDAGDGYLLWANATSDAHKGLLGSSASFINLTGENIDRLVMAAWRPFIVNPTGEAPELAVPIELVGQQRFTCCSLTFDDDGEATDANYGLRDYPDRIVLPAGTWVRITEAKKDEVKLEEIGGGRHLSIKLEYGRDWIGAVAYFRLLFPEAPPAEIMGRPQEIVAAVRDGVIAHGMTKEEVLRARGYPPFHRTPGVESNDWVYYDAPGEGEFVFFTDGKVTAIRTGEAP